jgi:lipoate-protein ligase A
LSAPWRLLFERGALADVGPRDFDGVPTVVSRHVDEPALVLGSTQPDVPFRGVPVVRRRSGGGAVLVGPGLVAWVDVFVPAGHPLWEDDVGRAFWWLGEAWAGALSALGVASGVALPAAPVVHQNGLVVTPWSRDVCFAGLGPGEVTVDGGKSVGMAQRRSREGALFQCALALSWDPARYAQLLALGPDAAEDLQPMVHAVGPVGQDDCTMALLDHFPSSP